MRISRAMDSDAAEDHLLRIRRPGRWIAPETRAGRSGLAAGVHDRAAGYSRPDISDLAGRQNGGADLNARSGGDGCRHTCGVIDLEDLTRLFSGGPHAEFPGVLCGHAGGEQGLAVREPLRRATEVAMFGDALQAGAIGMHDVDVDEVETLPAAFGGRQVAAAIRRERDPLPIG